MDRSASFVSSMPRRAATFSSSWTPTERLCYRLVLTPREKVKANQEKMQVIAMRTRKQAKDNARFHYEHLCNQEIMKSYVLHGK